MNLNNKKKPDSKGVLSDEELTSQQAIADSLNDSLDDELTDDTDEEDLYTEADLNLMTVPNIKQTLKDKKIAFKLLEFIKIISYDLFESMDYDVYLTIIKYLKQVYENEVIKYSKLELNDNYVIETEEKNIYLKNKLFDKYYSIDKLIHENM